MTNSEEPETPRAADRPRSARGASFPRMTLQEAAQAVKEASKVGSQHSAASMASALGHASPNSGTFRQKLADLREFEFVTGRGDDLELTALALRIARPLSAADADDAFRESFLGCEIFADMYQIATKGENIPLVTIANFGIHKLGVAQHSADRFAQCFSEGAAAAQLGERDDLAVTLWEAEQSIGAGATTEPAVEDGAGTTGDDGRPFLQPAVQQVWPVGGGNITLSVRFPGALPSTAFGPLGKAMETVEELVAHLRACLAEDRSHDESED